MGSKAMRKQKPPIKCGERSTHAKFYKEEQNTGHHSDHPTGLARYCERCMHADILDDKEGELIGCLPESESKQYAKLKSPQSAHHIYHNEGFTVATLDPSAQIIATSLAEKLESHVEEKNLKAQRLRHDNPNAIGKPKQNADFLNQRAWRQIYPPGVRENFRAKPPPEQLYKNVEGKSVTTANGFLHFAELMHPVLGKTIFPDEYYATLAHNCASKLTNSPAQKCDLKLFDLFNINFLTKGPGMNEPQRPHIDGDGFKVVVILVFRCGKRGYDFYYVPGSHNLLDQHDLEQYVPRQMLKRVLVGGMNESRGVSQALIFSEALIHSGGTSSMTTDEHAALAKSCGGGHDQWLAGARLAGMPPTDISFQATLMYNPIPSGVGGGAAAPTWYHGIAGEDDMEVEEIDKFKKYIKKGEEGSYFTSMRKEGLIEWVKMVQNPDHKPGKKRSAKSNPQYCPAKRQSASSDKKSKSGEGPESADQEP